MDKLIGTVLVVMFVIVVFLGVIQTGVGKNITDQGDNINTQFGEVETTPIGGN